MKNPMQFRLNQALAIIGLLFLFASAAEAATFQVTTAADNGDNVNPTAGSLRQAIIMANASPGTDTITFQIGSGVQTISPPAALPDITDPVVIDATTQPGFSGKPIIELDGTSAGTTAAGFKITGGASTVKGFVINRFDIGIYITPNGNNTITGNYIGTDVTGTLAIGNRTFGINIESANNNKIGGAASAERNIISGTKNNTGLRLSGSSSNTIQGNYIGTDVTGSFDLGNGNQGMRIDNGTNNLIGGANAGEGNVISGNFDVGLRITSSGSNKVIGNKIGTDAAGLKNIGNDGGGVGVFNGQNNLISANTIAFNGSANATTLGIELDVDGVDPPDGVTPNDQNDADTGSNGLQNFPVITNVTPQAASTTIQGTLNSTADTKFHIEFFASVQCDPSGNGEGQTYLGATDVTTVGNDIAFNVTLPVAIQSNQFVTATATDPNNNTSEFSKCAAGGAPVLKFSQQNYSVNESATTADITVNRTGDASTAVSVDYFTLDNAGLTPCQVKNGLASERCDYATSVGTLRFAPGETSKVIQIPLINDTYVDGTESFLLRLSTPQSASLGDIITGKININDDDSQSSVPTPIDNQAFFIGEQYIDFLGRLPDGLGFQNWSNTLNPCPGGGYGLQNPNCDRVHVAQSFYQSEEFQGRGFWAYKFYEVAFGRRPAYAEFIPDMATVGGPKSPQEEQLSKQQFIDSFVLRQEFLQKYGGLNDPAAYVDALLQSAGLPNLSIRTTLIAQLQANQISRAQALRQIVEAQEVTDRFYNRGFISMMYFGFLRRDPDTVGFTNYMQKLQQSGDPRPIVFDFIYSTEYRGRFGKP